MKILLLCTGNSCRSQMAHGYLQNMLRSKASIYSAGVEAHGVNPLSIKVMQEDDIDISMNTSNTMSEYINLEFDYIFTLGEKARLNCLSYPGNPTKIHKAFTDPYNAKGAEAEVLEVYKKVRDEIKEYFAKWLSEIGLLVK